MAPAYLQPSFKNGQIILPDKRIARRWTIWQARMRELVLFPEGEHDDFSDGLRAMEKRGGWGALVIERPW